MLLTAVLLTVAHANGKANALVLPVEDHVEALHDHGSHHRSRAGLRHSKLIAVLLGGRHVLHGPQVLLRKHTKANTRCLWFRSSGKKKVNQKCTRPGVCSTWGRIEIRKD